MDGFFFALIVFGAIALLIMLMRRKDNETEKEERRDLVQKIYAEILTGNRGTIYGDARFAGKDEVERNFARGGGILLGGVVGGEAWGNTDQLTYNGDQHILLMSMARGGKFARFICPNLLYLEDRSIIVIDPKGQAAAVTARRRREMGHKVIFINPFEMHCCEPWNLQGSGFNPLAALNPESANFVDRTMSITEALIQDGGKDNQHWAESARDILTAIVMNEIVKGGITTLRDMRDVLTMPEKERLSYVQAMTTCGFEAVEELAGRFLSQNNEINGIFSEAITQTRFLTSPLIKKCLDNDDFRFEQLKEEKITVYIIIPARYLKSQSRFLRLMVVSAVDAMLSSEKKQGENSTLLILDEFPALGYLSSVENAMGLAAGYGLQLWPIIQDFNQLRAIYGERWETFLGNTGVKIIKGANDNFTAEYISKMLGEMCDFTKTANMGTGDTYTGMGNASSASSNRGHSVTSTFRPFMPVHQLRGERFENGHLIIKSNLAYTVDAFTQPYYQENACGGWFGGKFDPDPYHMPK